MMPDPPSGFAPAARSSRSALTAMRRRAWAFAVALILSVGGTLHLAPTASAAEPVQVIWDDDCGSDLDCVYSLTALHRSIASGRVKALAFIVDSPNPYGGPVFQAWNDLWGQSIPIGAFRETVGQQGSGSGWSRAVRDAFRPGDLSGRYDDCVPVYRRALANAANHSVRLIETGFPTCLVAVMRSPPDVISPLSGRQLLKSKVQALFVMGGDYPGPATEFNFKTAAQESSYLFRHWTTQAGYPPVYLNGFTPGSRIAVGSTAASAASAAIAIAEKAAGETARPVWDLMSVHQAVGGTKDYLVSANGTNSVDARTGRNLWTSVRRSGHYYVTTRSETDYRSLFSAFVDGP